MAFRKLSASFIVLVLLALAVSDIFSEVLNTVCIVFQKREMMNCTVISLVCVSNHGSGRHTVVLVELHSRTHWCELRGMQARFVLGEDEWSLFAVRMSDPEEGQQVLTFT